MYLNTITFAFSRNGQEKNKEYLEIYEILIEMEMTRGVERKVE